MTTPASTDHKDWKYSGRELESMSFALNYHRWILSLLKPYLGKTLVEVGAGTGSFSELLLETKPQSLVALEPSANMYPALAAMLASTGTTGICTAYQSTLVQTFENSVFATPPDSVVYINVLEHIDDDEKELRTVYSLLPPNGRILIFVPANRWLMGSMDRLLGHFRRYSMNELTTKCRAAGFQIRATAHFDFIGMLPWWLKYCVLKSDRMEPAAVRLYDRWVVPVARSLERIVPPPIGKNIIVIGEKPI